jgi:hypothetical protein
VLAPGAAPGAIRLAFAGASTARLDAAGDLVLVTGQGDLVQHAPVVYQQTGGGRTAVAGSYALLGDGQVGFRVGAYDPSRPLVIDPSVSYSTYLGAPENHEVHHVAVDAAGSAYLVGTRTRPSLQPDTEPNTKDAFVAKLDALGQLVYLTYVGGTTGPMCRWGPGNEEGNGIAVDPFGQAYITGWTSSYDFLVTAPAGVMPYQTRLTYDPMTDPLGAFVNAFLTESVTPRWNLFINFDPGGWGNDYAAVGPSSATGVALSADYRHVFVTGYTSATDIVTTPNAFQPLPSAKLGQSPADAYEAYVVKINLMGHGQVYDFDEPGAGPGQAGAARPAHRHLLPGSDPLRAGDAPAGLRRRRSGGAAVADRLGGAAPAAAAE